MTRRALYAFASLSDLAAWRTTTASNTSAWAGPVSTDKRKLLMENIAMMTVTVLYVLQSMSFLNLTLCSLYSFRRSFQGAVSSSVSGSSCKCPPENPVSYLMLYCALSLLLLTPYLCAELSRHQYEDLHPAGRQSIGQDTYWRGLFRLG